MNNYENEQLPKHRKKKESNVSKSKSRSNHKHTYVDCVLINETTRPDGSLRRTAHRGQYCTICGKIGKESLWEHERTPEGYYRVLTCEEVIAKYPKLPRFYAKFLDKYVTIEGEYND